MEYLLGMNDLKILSYLREDARMNLTSMSRQSGIPVSTIFDRLKKFQDSIITKHTALIDFSKIGFNLKLNLIIKVDRQNKEKLKEYLIRESRVNSVYKINNGYDFMVEAFFRNINEITEFVEKLDDFKVKCEEYYILEEIKKEAFMSDPSIVDLLVAKL